MLEDESFRYYYYYAYMYVFEKLPLNGNTLSYEIISNGEHIIYNKL